MGVCIVYLIMGADTQLPPTTTYEEPNPLLKNQPVFSCPSKRDPFIYILLIVLFLFLLGLTIWIWIVAGWTAGIIILVELLVVPFIILILPKRLEVWPSSVKVNISIFKCFYK